MSNDTHIRSGRIAVISGGVGAARMLRGLAAAVDPDRITALVNTGDDTVLHGLSISPDLDTIVYTLADAIDPERGWGLVDETWRAMGALDRYAAIRPPDSQAAPQWFNLGDQDLATHFYRTARLQEGATLTEVTDEIRQAWGVPIRMLPMSDRRRSTIVTVTADPDAGGEPRDVSFQDYFVRLRHGVPVSAVRFDGDAELTPSARASILDAETIVIAPSNPVVSIGPLRSLDGVDEMLTQRRDDVVAVSPIIGGAALKGPADRMLVELGHEASVVGVARLYAEIASVLVIDPVDAHLSEAVEATGMRCVVTPSVMSTPAIARRLAEVTLESVAGPGETVAQ
ncbi:2-phospho-L-lactate transferase [Ilumatobacter sp.]|uniref:2-phospho-L-lactate transferase n=1 Tax=Ilumatobacter sp. TaxID=1967498 RepID=UPI003C52AE73